MCRFFWLTSCDIVARKRKWHVAAEEGSNGLARPRGKKMPCMLHCGVRKRECTDDSRKRNVWRLIADEELGERSPFSAVGAIIFFICVWKTTTKAWGSEEPIPHICGSYISAIVLTVVCSASSTNLEYDNRFQRQRIVRRQRGTTLQYKQTLRMWIFKSLRHWSVPLSSLKRYIPPCFFFF